MKKIITRYKNKNSDQNLDYNSINNEVFNNDSYNNINISKFSNINNKFRKGSILLVVLIVIAASTSITLFMHEKAMNAFGTVTTLQSEYQGAIYAMTAIQALEMAFIIDQNDYDGKDELWNTIPPIAVGNGFLNITISPLNAKLPLSPLGVKVDPTNMEESERIRRYETAFTEILDKYELKNVQLYELKSWMGSGFENYQKVDEYGKEYSVKGKPLETLAELAYIPTFDFAFNKISKYVSIGEEGENKDKVNVNFADADVIKTLVPEISNSVEEIIKKRDEEPFTDTSAIWKLVSGGGQSGDSADLLNTINKYLTVKSSMFHVKIELEVGTDSFFYHLLVKRENKKVKPIKYIEGYNVDYF